MSDTKTPVKKFTLRPAEDMILTQADINLCLGSQELLSCPFCGSLPMSSGTETPNGRAICWKITCLSMDGIIPNCTASVWATDPDQEKARATAVARWNHRPSLPVSEEKGAE